MQGPDAAAAGGMLVRRRRVRRLTAALLLVLLLELAGAMLGRPGGSQPDVSAASTGQAAAGNGGFVISSTITAFPECRDPAALAPDVDRCLVYTVRNPGSSQITVTAISIAIVDAPDTCPSDNLDLVRTSFTGVLAVAADGTASTPGLPIALRDTGKDQDGCRGATFTFTFSGTAHNGTGSQ